VIQCRRDSAFAFADTPQKCRDETRAQRTLLTFDRARAQVKRLGPPANKSLRERIAACEGPSARGPRLTSDCSTATIQKDRRLR
jgi:hypothetical protein